MHGGHDIPDIVFRYRKRKQVSLDGRTPGLEYPTRHRGHTRPPTTGHAAQINGDEYEALNQREQYLPGRGFYSHEGTAYRRPSSWNDASFAGTPPIRHSSPPDPLPPAEPEINHDLTGWPLGAFVSKAANARGSETSPPDEPFNGPRVDIRAILDPTRRKPPTMKDIWRRVLAQAEYEESVRMGNILAEIRGGYSTAPPPESLEAGPPDPFYPVVTEAYLPSDAIEDPTDQAFVDPCLPEETTPDQGLEDILDSALESALVAQPMLDDLVDDAWRQLDASAIPDPRMMDMQMDPFGPMPPGLGPM